MAEPSHTTPVSDENHSSANLPPPHSIRYTGVLHITDMESLLWTSLPQFLRNTIAGQRPLKLWS